MQRQQVSHEATVMELRTEIKALHNKVEEVKTEALIASWVAIIKIYGCGSYKEGRDSVLGYLESQSVG